MMIRRGFLAGSAATAVGACTMQAGEVDQKTGRLPTGSRIAPEEILVDKPAPAGASALALTRWETAAGNSAFVDFHRDQVRKLGVFREVLNRTQFEQMLISRNLAGDGVNARDMLGLRAARQKIGPFLVIDMELARTGVYTYEANMTATDPATADAVFKLRRSAFNFAGLDEPLFYPLYNALADWLRKSGGV